MRMTTRDFRIQVFSCPLHADYGVDRIQASATGATAINLSGEQRYLE